MNGRPANNDVEPETAMEGSGAKTKAGLFCHFAGLTLSLPKFRI
jgi:hypothetical protein